MRLKTEDLARWQIGELMSTEHGFDRPIELGELLVPSIAEIDGDRARYFN